MSIFDKLRTNQKFKALNRSSDYEYFLNNRKLFIQYNCFLSLYNADDDFNVIKANIILKSLANKLDIERRLKALGDDCLSDYKQINHHQIRQAILNQKTDMPYITEGKYQYYVPIFNRAMNYIYAYEPDKLFDYPYHKIIDDCSTSLIDPFETYNYVLYDSYFTKLVKIKGDRTSIAFYHVDYKTVYIINNQGRLDVKIALFDKYMKRPNYDMMLDRIIIILDAYFNNDRDGFISSLLEQKLISNRMHSLLIRK
jgi:hypothetical protein